MAKYDAFGRRIGEDTLAEAGWRRRGAATERPAVEVADDAPRLTAPSPVPGSPRRRRGMPMAVAMVMVTFFAIVGFGVFLAFRAVGDAIDQVTGNPPARELPEVVLPEREDLVRGLDPESFLHPDRLGPALRELQDAGRPLVVRVAPERIDVQAVNGGHLDALQFDRDGLKRLARSPGHGALPTFRWSRVDPQAPRRLTRAAEQQFAIDPNEVDYLLLMALDGEPRWNAYYRGGRFHFTAAPDGSDLKRVT